MVKTKTYPSGLKLIVEKTKSQYSSLGIGVCCGSVNEKENEFGLAHFLEHLFFKSTKTKSTTELSTLLEFYGAQINAFTSHQETFYFFNVINENFEKCFELYSDMFFNGIFNKTEVDSERKVILEEIKMHQDDSVNYLLDKTNEKAYENTPYCHLILGNEKTIKNCTINDIKNFKKRNYIAPNLTISVSGGISFSKMDKMIKNLFETNFKRHSKTNYFSKTQYESKIKTKILNIQKEDKQVNLFIGIRGLTSLNKNKTIQDFYNVIMGGGMSSRMFIYLREQRGFCYSTRIYNFNMLGINNLYFYIGTSKDKVLECVNGIKYLINDAAEKGFSKQEFEKAKNKLKSKLIFDNKPNTNAQNNFINLNLFEKYISPTQKRKEIENTTLQQVNDFAKQIANEKNYIVSAIGNKVNNEDLKHFGK